MMSLWLHKPFLLRTVKAPLKLFNAEEVLRSGSYLTEIFEADKPRAHVKNVKVAHAFQMVKKLMSCT